jgi:hypothetical protein
MQLFSIAWRLLLNLATGSVILAMFHIANSPFETVVISALVLIYLSVIGSYMSLGYALSKKWNIDLVRYIAIAKSLGLNAGLEEEAQKENLEEDRKSQSVFWIIAGFNMLFGLIAMGNLIYAIAS